MANKHIMLTAVGSSSAFGAINTYHRMGMRVTSSDIYPFGWTCGSLSADRFYQIPPVANDSAFLSELTQIVKNEQIQMIIPLIDPEVDLLCSKKKEFHDIGCTICTPSERCTRLCRDKQKITDLLAEKGICRTIPTYNPYTPHFQPESFPAILKPVHGRSSQHFHIINSASELTGVISERDDFILQPFITGDVFTVDVGRDSFGNVQALARHELLRTLNGLGTTVETLPDHPLEEICNRIANEIDLLGVVNMEFIAHENEYYFLEINPRFSGGLAFSQAAGLDFAEIEVLCHTGQSISHMPLPHHLLLTRKNEPVISMEVT